MTPLVGLESLNPNEIDYDEYKDFTDNVLELVVRTLNVPDPEDIESRMVIKTNNVTDVLRISYTIGPNEYPDAENPRFEPEVEERRALGKEIFELKEQYNFPDFEIQIEEYKDSVFRIFNSTDLFQEMYQEGRLEKILSELKSNEWEFNIYVNNEMDYKNLDIDLENPNVKIILVEGSDVPIAIEFDSYKPTYSRKTKEELADELQYYILSRLPDEYDVNCTVWIRDLCDRYFLREMI